MLDRLLRDHKFVLVRQDRHRIYKNPDGKIWVTSSTPSDSYHGLKNAIATLRAVIAAPPRSEVLSVEDYRKREAAIQLEKIEKTVAGEGGGRNGNGSNGSGFRDVVVRVGPNGERLTDTRGLRRITQEEWQARQDKMKADKAAKWEAERPTREAAAAEAAMERAIRIAENRNDLFILKMCQDIIDHRENFNPILITRKHLLSTFKARLQDYTPFIFGPMPKRAEWIKDEDGLVDIQAEADWEFKDLLSEMEELWLENGRSKSDERNFSRRDFNRFALDHGTLAIQKSMEDIRVVYTDLRKLSKSFLTLPLSELAEEVRRICRNWLSSDYQNRLIENIAEIRRIIVKRDEGIEAEFPEEKTRWVDFWKVWDEMVHEDFDRELVEKYPFCASLVSAEYEMDEAEEETFQEEINTA